MHTAVCPTDYKKRTKYSLVRTAADVPPTKRQKLETDGLQRTGNLSTSCPTIEGNKHTSYTPGAFTPSSASNISVQIGLQARLSPGVVYKQGLNPHIRALAGKQLIEGAQAARYIQSRANQLLRAPQPANSPAVVRQQRITPAAHPQSAPGWAAASTAARQRAAAAAAAAANAAAYKPGSLPAKAQQVSLQSQPFRSHKQWVRSSSDVVDNTRPLATQQVLSNQGTGAKQLYTQVAGKKTAHNALEQPPAPSLVKSSCHANVTQNAAPLTVVIPAVAGQGAVRKGAAISTAAQHEQNKHTNDRQQVKQQQRIASSKIAQQEVQEQKREEVPGTLHSQQPGRPLQQRQQGSQGTCGAPAGQPLLRMQSTGRVACSTVDRLGRADAGLKQQAIAAAGRQGRSWSRGRSAGALQLIVSTAKVRRCQGFTCGMYTQCLAI